MESDVTQSALFYKLWAWGDKNRKQLLYGLVALVVVGIIAAFWLSHASEKQIDANNALSKLTSRNGIPNAAAPDADAFLKVASDYSGTDAGQRALLLGAGDLFAAGKYDVAMAQFQKFIQDYNTSPFVSQAALGIASCYDALGKTNDAVSGYQGVIDRYGTANVVPQAKLRLARLLEAQGKFKEARLQFEDLSHSYPGTLSSEAVTLLDELNAAHPELNTAPAPSPAASAFPTIKATPAAPAVPAPKTPAPATTNLKAP